MIHSPGPESPFVFCCVPTAMLRAKRQHISKLIGVGKSSHSLSSNSKPAVSANDPLYRPTKLIKQLAATGQISGFHISTFNRLSATREFHRTHICVLIFRTTISESVLLTNISWTLWPLRHPRVNQAFRGFPADSTAKPPRPNRIHQLIRADTIPRGRVFD